MVMHLASKYLVSRHATETKETKIFLIKITRLKIPTGWGQTIWLYTECVRYEFRAAGDKFT